MSKMHVNIPFDDIVDAFEQSRVDQHYFLDPQKKEIIYINDGFDENVEEKLEELEESNAITFPVRLPREDFLIMEHFAYALEESGEVDQGEALLQPSESTIPSARSRGGCMPFLTCGRDGSSSGILR